jgi:hypothetical protein
MFEALLSYPQEALHKRHLVYCLHVVSVEYTRIGAELTQHALNTPSAGVRRLLRMSNYCSEHVEALNS